MLLVSPTLPQSCLSSHSETGANVWIPVWSHRSPLQHSTSRTETARRADCSLLSLICGRVITLPWPFPAWYCLILLYLAEEALAKVCWLGKKLCGWCTRDFLGCGYNRNFHLKWLLCCFPYGSGDLIATHTFMCKTLPIAWYKDL